MKNCIPLLYFIGINESGMNLNVQYNQLQIVSLSVPTRASVLCLLLLLPSKIR